MLKKSFTEEEIASVLLKADEEGKSITFYMWERIFPNSKVQLISSFIIFMSERHGNVVLTVPIQAVENYTVTASIIYISLDPESQ